MLSVVIYGLIYAFAELNFTVFYYVLALLPFTVCVVSEHLALVCKSLALSHKIAKCSLERWHILKKDSDWFKEGLHVFKKVGEF